MLKEVIGFEGYFVDDEGNVYSTHRGSLKKLKLQEDKAGYLYANLYKDKRLKSVKVHKLVIESFIGERPDPYAVCCHTDGNKTNNKSSNLRWGTVEDNEADGVKHGSWKGENNGRSVLTEEDVKFIRNTKEIFKTSFLADLYGVRRETISQVILGKSWKHVKLER